MPGVRDFDRTLDESGVIDAEIVGDTMNRNGYVPDLTLCSGAARARQTLEGVAARTDTGKIVFDDTLYLTDAAGYLEIVRTNCTADSILIIGHNPMIEDLAMAVAGEGDAVAMNSLNSGFPTSGLAVIRFEGGLCSAAPSKGYLESFHAPREE